MNQISLRKIPFTSAVKCRTCEKVQKNEIFFSPYLTEEQSVSKWEGAQSIPDYEKIIHLSDLFGVSIDYLLKDEIEEAEFSNSSKEVSSIRRVSMEEADAFLSIKASTSKSIAYATFLCILSPICMFILGAISETPKYRLAENVAGGTGMIVLLILVAAAVAIFVSCSNKSASYEYLEKGVFETEYGVIGMVRARKEQYKNIYTKNNMMGSCLCIIALIPLFGGAIINDENDLFLTLMLSLTLIIAGIGIVFFIRNGIVWASFEKLLQEGDYSKKKKENQPIITAISVSYWMIAAAIYLAYSLVTNDWGRSWIVWPIAGLLYPALIGIFNAFNDRK